MLPYVEVVDRVSWFNPDIPNPVGRRLPRRAAVRRQGHRAALLQLQHAHQDALRTTGARALGFAYRLGDKTVIRAGYGMMYTRHGAVGGRGGARDGTGKLGFTAAPGFVSPGRLQPGVQLGRRRARLSEAAVLRRRRSTPASPPSGPPAAASPTTIPEEGARPPRYQNWNFSIQRAIDARR